MMATARRLHLDCIIAVRVLNRIVRVGNKVIHFVGVDIDGLREIARRPAMHFLTNMDAIL